MAELSEFNVRVVQVGDVQKHPNADSLSITNIEGYPVIIKTGSFHPGDRAVYVPVDALVPTSRPEFQFLRKEGVERHRIKAVRLRGVFSCGLLVPADPSWALGQNVQAELDIEKWVPPSERSLEQSGLVRPGKPGKPSKQFAPIYGLDSYRKYGHVLVEGEPVVITEKIHGSNARYLYEGGRLWVGSHKMSRGSTRSRLQEMWDRVKLRILGTFGKKHRAHLFMNTGDVWWQIAEQYDLKNKLSKYPGYIFYGEIYGERVQDLTYDSPTGRKLKIFDIREHESKRWLEHSQVEAICRGLDLETVPLLYTGPWSKDLEKLANGPSTLAKHTREGVVIRTVPERFDTSVGRVALKLVGEDYLLRKGAD